MPSLTVENYLKTILQITIREDLEIVSTGLLAEEMNLLPGTVTSMLKTLADAKLAIYKPYEGITLTRQGTTLAMRMLRRHRLIELFLVKTLNLKWDQVHEEAENMEHAVSDFLIDQIDDFLEHPKTDPHGDPIPSRDGKMRTSTDAASRLTECATGTKVRFIRVLDQESNFLKKLTKNGIALGDTGTVESNAEKKLTISTTTHKTGISLSHQSASHLLVEILSTTSSKK